MLALSMMLSVVPAKVWATETDDSNIIYKENFDGKTMADFSDWVLESKDTSVYAVEAKSADSDDDYTKKQINIFNDLCKINLKYSKVLLSYLKLRISNTFSLKKRLLYK